MAAATRSTTTFGVLGLCCRRYSHKIPFIVKINHNELLTYPNERSIRSMFGSVDQAYDLGGGRRRRHHLLRLARVPPPDPSSR